MIYIGMRGIFVLFLSLALGYILCVIAKKQEGLLKAVGNALGVAIIAITLILGLLSAQLKCGALGKLCASGKMPVVCPTTRTP